MEVKPAVRERPILFSGPMVRAILEGRKTQTRRIVTPQPVPIPAEHLALGGPRDRCTTWWRCSAVQTMVDLRDMPWLCPYGAVGDRLWVRETWSTDNLHVYPCPRIWYRADRPFDEFDVGMHDDCSPPLECRRGPSGECLHGFRWRPSIHMPRWASRLSLEITGVRVERLHAISEEDARAEGVSPAPFCKAGRPPGMEHVEAFEDLWSSISGAESWDANPWVWVVELKRVGGAP